MYCLLLCLICVNMPHLCLAPFDSSEAPAWSDSQLSIAMKVMIIELCYCKREESGYIQKLLFPAPSLETF